MGRGNGPDPIDREVGQRVRERRAALGLSQGALGDAIGVTFQQVQKYERGANRISASRLHRIAELLQVTPTYFFGNDEIRASSSVDPTDLAADLLASEEGPKLIAAFGRISDARIRRQLVALVQELADRHR
jgi:transcriptional regulator with XRE-family HTH domain